MSLYRAIDESLYRWAAANQVVVLQEYKDFEVRSLNFWTDYGYVQMWVDPQSGEKYEVVASNNRQGAKRRIDRVPVDGADIASALNGLVALVQGWEPW